MSADPVDWVEYRIYCTTEAAWKTWKLDADDAEPTTCPTDTAHTVNLSSVSETDRRADNDVHIAEESGPLTTGGHFQATSYRINAAANTTTTVDIVEPLPLAPFVIKFRTKATHEGDIVNMHMAPNTVIGAITADVSVSDTVINVSQTVVDNTEVGYLLNLFDGANTDALGRVLAVDKNALTVTIETAATQAFAAVTPTYVRQSIEYVRNYEIGPAGSYVVGESKIGGSYVPAGVTVRIMYENKHATDAKVVVAYLDRTY